jgi:hypothetical protein
MAQAPKAQFGVLEGTLVYVKVAQPDTKYESTDLEWSVEVIVDEETAEGWDEQFKKQPSKKVKVADFEQRYKIPCPIEGVKNVYSIKLKRAATNDGVPVDEKFAPKVFLDDEDGERTDITRSRLLANGSFGKVSYYISENGFGRFSRLQNVLLDTKGFKEYIRSGGTGVAPGGEFGEVKAVKVEPASEAATNSRPAKPAKKLVVEQESDDSESSPF